VIRYSLTTRINALRSKPYSYTPNLECFLVIGSAPGAANTVLQEPKINEDRARTLGLLLLDLLYFFVLFISAGG